MMAARRMPGCLWLLLAPAAALIAAAAGIWIYSAPAHPDRSGVPTTVSIPPAAEWAAAGRQATAHFPRFVENPRHGMHLMRPVDLWCYSGASVFVSTPTDLARFALGLQNGKLLKPATVNRLHTPQRRASGQETGYGPGWEVEPAAVAGKSVRSAGHSGVVQGGDVADLRMYPEHGMAVAVLANIAHARTRHLAGRIAGEFLREARGAAGK